MENIFKIEAPVLQGPKIIGKIDLAKFSKTAVALAKKRSKKKNILNVAANATSTSSF